MAKTGIVKEFIQFLWKEKYWWLIPIVLILLSIGLLLVLSAGTIYAPFIYTLF